jgi:hypothetical protein
VVGLRVEQSRRQLTPGLGDATVVHAGRSPTELSGFKNKIPKNKIAATDRHFKAFTRMFLLILGIL